MTAIVEALRSHPFFHDLSVDTVTAMADHGSRIGFAPDQRIITAGESADTLFIVISGHVALELTTPGRGTHVIETLGTGEVLGVSWLLPPYRSSLDARAIEATSVISIDAVALRKQCDDDPVLGYAIYRQFSGVIRERLQTSRVRLLDLYRSHVD
jgi:CRP/FNR family cyclic AMP-dependent transcriptional regulator